MTKNEFHFLTNGFEGTAEVTSIEYAIPASLIVLAIIPTVTLLGLELEDLYSSIVGAFP